MPVENTSHWKRWRFLTRKVRRALESGKSAREILLRKVQQRETLTAILLMIPSAATTMLAYYGVSVPLEEQGGGLETKGQSLAFALTIGVFAWLGWFYGFGLAYRLSGARLRTAMSAGVFYLVMLVLIDAPLNALALAGGTAVQMSIADTSTYYEAQAGSVTRQSAQTQKLRPAIRAQITRFENLGVSEEKFGSFSGSSGPGKLSAGFFQVRDLLQTLDNELGRGIAAGGSVQSDIKEALADLKAQTYTTGPLRPRVREASIVADRLDAALLELDRYDYRVSIRATLASLEASLPTPNGASSAFEKRQNDELAVIAKMAAPVAAILRAALDDLDTSAVELPRRQRPEHALTAIRTYWKPLIFQWIAAVFIDVAPAALLVMLTAAYREAGVRPVNPTTKSNEGDT